ncbi:MAG TPA: TIR domain-containing protein [Candidatus Tectomicrobia bacterium]
MADQWRVFISYARQDGEAFATALRRRLEKEEPEITLWQDRTEMEGGVGWWKQIEEAIAKCAFLVIVMTPSAMRSEVTRKEWRYARQHGICVYPVKGTADSELDYRSLPKWMSKAHFFDLDREWETFIHYLKSPYHAARVPFMAPDLPEGFVERPALTECLLGQLLDASRENPVAITTALRGAGGLGKTTLAAALCHREEVLTAFGDGILWVTLGQKPNLQEGLTKLYAALTGERPGFVDEEDAAFHLSEQLQDKNCLIVIDDAWNLAHLRPFMHAGSGCSRLITTRSFEIATEARRVEVDEMTSTEAVRMLTARLSVLPTTLERFSALADRLGAWPLLLELANAALRQRVERGDSVEGALSYLQRKLDEQGVVAFDRRNATARNQALTRTIELGLDELDAQERERYEELSIFPEGIELPLSVVACLWACDAFEAEELIQRFDSLSLVKFSVQTATFRLHDVMRGYLATRLADPAVLHGKLIDAWADLYRLREAYAWRWFAYHLVEAGRNQQLRALLLSFDWLQAKLEATDATALASDFGFFAHDRILRTVHGAVRLAAHVLARDKTQLAGQLLGRLTAGEPLEIASLCEQASHWRGTIWLRPLEPALTEPGGPLLFTLTGHSGAVRAVAVTPDGRHAVSGADDLTVRVWDLQRGTQVHALYGHTDWIRAVVVSNDSHWAISTGDDQTIHLWDITVGVLLRVLDGHGDWPKTVALTSDNRNVLIAGNGRNIRILALDNGATVQTLRGHRGAVNALALTSDSKYALSASDDRTLRVWDLERGTELCALPGHAAQVVALAPARDDRFVVSASRDDTLRCWSCNAERDAKPSLERVITHQAYWVRAVALTPDGRHVVTGSDDCSLKVWDVNTGSQIHVFEGHIDWINALAVTPDGEHVVSASPDHTLKVWDLKSAAQRSERKGHTERVRALVSTADGRVAVSTSDDRQMKLWDLKERSEVRVVVHNHSHWPVAMSPDGRFIASAAGDATVRILDGATGAVQRVLSGHTDRVRAVVVTAGSRWVISAADDRSIRVWDPGSGETLSIINTHRHWVRALALTPDGRFL